MARGYKRLSRKAQHLIRRLKRASSRSVQQAIHPRAPRMRSTGAAGSGPEEGPRPRGTPAVHRPLTRKAKQILSRLRKTKVVVGAEAAPGGTGTRDGARQAPRRAGKRDRGAGTQEGEAGRETDPQRRQARPGHRQADLEPRRPGTARAAGKAAQAASRAQEPLLTRHERKQAERAKRGPRTPPAPRRDGSARPAGSAAVAGRYAGPSRSPARRAPAPRAPAHPAPEPSRPHSPLIPSAARPPRPGQDPLGGTMKPRHITRAIVVAGWLAGLALILAGLPLWAALAVLVAATAAGVAWLRWGAAHLVQLAREVVRLRLLIAPDRR